MKSFVKSALFSALGVGCLALGSGAQQPAPTPPASPASPAPVVFGQGGTPLIPGQGTYTGRFATTENGTTIWYAGAHDHETMTIAKQLASAKGESEKEKLREKLLDSLEKAFDDRQKRQEKEIAALEAQVKKLKEMVSKRQEAKKEIIAERVKQLEREAKGLGW
jgi:hypothetical protein